jgi:hypothetical protein
MMGLTGKNRAGRRGMAGIKKNLGGRAVNVNLEN